MKTKDLILIALVCANITLAAVAVTIHVGRAESAAIAATGSRSGDYVMVSGPVSSSREGILVIDVVAKRANFYVPKSAAGVSAGGAWDLTSSRSLTQDFAGGPR
jgi:hypothetical protein